VNFQSVMDRPDRVRRVAPPKATMDATQAAHPPSHQARARRAWGGRSAATAALVVRREGGACAVARGAVAVEAGRRAGGEMGESG